MSDLKSKSYTLHPKSFDTILIHICCSVDSHFFLQELREVYPKAKLIGFFYDPNIHPYSEYKLRLMDVERSCKSLDIELIEGEYDFESWLNGVKGYENEPEKGKRCELCFDIRVERSFKKAKELGVGYVTTTLLTSPKKSIEQLRVVGDKLADNYSLEFLSPDFRKNGGTQKQFLMAKEEKLYHQNYCGCLYALKKQRDMQNKEASELFMPINRQIEPGCIEERIENYKKRVELEESGRKYEFVKSNFLNYRVLRAYLKVDGKTLPSYPLSYSVIKRKKVKLRVEKDINGIFYANRESLKFIELSYLNEKLSYSFESLKELYFTPLEYKKELFLRREIEKSDFSTSPIVVVDKVNFEKFEIYIDATIFEDVRENLVIF